MPATKRGLCGVSPTYGRGSITRLVEGKRVTDWARFLTIWQRQRDGAWKIFRNVVLPAR